ncbi:MAG: DNA translocase FtsK 4TM domain-containing protein [Patescibacteria group bacterium]|nr:DNA translocase FtsK 4TM domain-containing protein [Patescibacteria group bacterium]
MFRCLVFGFLYTDKSINKTMSRRRKKRSALDYIRLPGLPHLDLDPDTKKGIFIVFILAIGAISLLGLFDMAGLMGQYLKTWLTVGLGWGKWLLPVVLIFIGYALFNEERFELKGRNFFGFLVFILSFQILLFLFIEHDRWNEALRLGDGGGYIGYYLADIFMKLMGLIASFIVSISLVVISLLLAFNTSLNAMFGRNSIMAKIFYPIHFVFNKLFNQEKEEEEEDDEDEEEEEDDEDEEEEEEEDDDDEEEESSCAEASEDKGGDEDDEEALEGKPEFNAKEIKEDESMWWMEPSGIDIKLPLSLLNSKKNKPTSGDIKQNKEIIQSSLANFGIQVEMSDVSVGPTVTQYTFRPSEGVKLSRVVNLSNDLALALAAHPIRIEAPIPGTHLVGVEVPNESKAIVNLREALNTKTYKKRNSNTMMVLGKDVAGKVWLDDITKMPHLLVAGATNSGKSVCLNTIIVSLLYQNSPDMLRFIMVDPKRVELPIYNNIPYLLAPVITEISKTVNALKWCLNEMERRFEVLQKQGQRNIQAYNESTEIKMPYIVFIIDELADLMVANAKEIEACVIRLAQMARAVGIHLILATQRPSVDVITGLIKANMPGRIAFSVASGTDSRTILDSLGAEKLLGRGDMLFANAELSKPIRLQGAFLSDDEIKKIVNYIKVKSKGVQFIKSVTERQAVKGTGGIGLDGKKGDEDELLHEAKENILQFNKASASFLQRKLRIGYARASSILDQLEEMGMVGPSNGAKPRNILISQGESDALDEQGTSGVSLHSRAESSPHENYLENEESKTPPVLKTENDDEETKEDKDLDEDFFAK